MMEVALTLRRQRYEHNADTRRRAQATMRREILKLVHCRQVNIQKDIMREVTLLEEEGQGFILGPWKLLDVLGLYMIPPMLGPA